MDEKKKGKFRKGTDDPKIKKTALHKATDAPKIKNTALHLIAEAPYVQYNKDGHRIKWIDAGGNYIDDNGENCIYVDKSMASDKITMMPPKFIPSANNHEFDTALMEFGGETFNSTNNSDNKVTVSDIDGYGARISIGRSF